MFGQGFSKFDCATLNRARSSTHPLASELQKFRIPIAPEWMLVLSGTDNEHHDSAVGTSV